MAKQTYVVKIINTIDGTEMPLVICESEMQANISRDLLNETLRQVSAVNHTAVVTSAQTVFVGDRHITADTGPKERA